MKKILMAFLGIVFCTGVAFAKDASNPASFSGLWVLDFGQTKNPPAGLQSYSMVVKQDQQQMKVETSLEGDLQAAPSQSGNAPGGGYPGGSGGMGRRGGMGGGVGMGRMGMDIPGGMGGPTGGQGGGGTPGGGRGGQRGEGRSQGSVAAYKLYPQSAVYRLDGSESTAQLGDAAGTDATLKAEWAKSGRELKLSMSGNEDSTQKGGKVQLKDQWKLSDDGKSITVERSIKSPEGSGTVHLVFIKKDATSPSSAE